MSEPKINEEHKQQDNDKHPKIIDSEELDKIFGEMISNQEKLKNGYNTLNKYEVLRNFHLAVLTNIFDNIDNVKYKKLACSAFNIYVRKNWNISNLITNEEKLV